MTYSEEIVIDLPRGRVVALFDDPDNLPKWQDGLQSFTPLDGAPGQPGSTSRIRYRMGRREIEMIETITARDLPDRFDATYETDGVWNIVQNRFSETEDGGTRWHIDTEFRCRGFLRIMATLMPGMFRRQTRKMMQDFKAFAEAQGA